MLVALGRDGMSSDESDGEDKDQRLVHTVPWRAPCVRIWLRTLDRIDASEPKRGRPGRRFLRLAVDKIGNSSVVSQLPINAYDSVWLASQSSTHIARLNAGPPYDFQHGQDAIE